MSDSSQMMDGFLGLPTELRLQIYGYITDTALIPTTSTMNPYQGLILSCRQVYQEFESEAVKSANNFLSTFKKEWATGLYGILVPLIQTFADTITITINITGNIPPPLQHIHFYRQPRYYPHIAALIHNLIHNLPSFRLCVLKADSPIVDMRFAYDCRYSFPQGWGQAGLGLHVWKHSPGYAGNGAHFGMGGEYRAMGRDEYWKHGLWCNYMVPGSGVAVGE